MSFSTNLKQRYDNDISNSFFSELMPPSPTKSQIEKYIFSKNQKRPEKSFNDFDHINIQKNHMSANDRRPTIPYAHLITLAIQSEASQKITLNGIYNYVMDTYPFFKTAGSGWKVQIKLIRTLSDIICR